MAFTSEVTVMVGLVEILLPTTTIRLCDGGFVNWPSKGMFTAEDANFGVVQSVEAINESVSDLAPSGRITLLPPSVALASALFRVDAQGSPIRFWLAEVDRNTGLLVGTPEIQFDGLVDQLKMRYARGMRTLELEFLSSAERLFFIREGNVLTPRFHQTAWPGEKGFDHCTGSGIQVAWGVPGPGRGVGFFTGGGGGSGGGGTFIGSESA